MKSFDNKLQSPIERNYKGTFCFACFHAVRRHIPSGELQGSLTHGYVTLNDCFIVCQTYRVSKYLSASRVVRYIQIRLHKLKTKLLHAIIHQYQAIDQRYLKGKIYSFFKINLIQSPCFCLKESTKSSSVVLSQNQKRRIPAQLTESERKFAELICED